MDVIRSHAEEFVGRRLAPAMPPNDGKQTPMRGHPVFLAQHGCACCCRGCLEKWHGIRAGVELSGEQQKYVVDTLMEWIRRQMEENHTDHTLQGLRGERAVLPGSPCSCDGRNGKGEA